jgi:hypothetical protein
MKEKFPKQPGGQDRGREERKEIFDFEIDEENRWIFFVGTKDDVLDMMARFAAAPMAADPDREAYARRYESHRVGTGMGADRFFANKNNGSQPYSFTASPFRLLIYPAEQAWASVKKRFGAKAGDDRWFAKMYTNSAEYTDEQKQRTWKEVKDNFERVRQEMVAERQN